MNRAWIGHRWCIDRAWESIKFNIMLNRLLKMEAIAPLLRGLRHRLAPLPCGFLLGFMGVANVLPMKRRRRSIAPSFSAKALKYLNGQANDFLGGMSGRRFHFL